jgi:hypothetical protein
LPSPARSIKARLAGLAGAHGWQQWEYLVTGLGPGEVSLRVRAADLAGQVQPDEPEWSRRGYGANVIHRIRVLLR